MIARCLARRPGAIQSTAGAWRPVRDLPLPLPYKAPSETDSATPGQAFENQEPKSLVINFARDPTMAYAFNVASMAFNNHFFFRGLNTNADVESRPSSDLQLQISRDFSSMDTLRETFLATAESMFGPGFVWLVQTDNTINGSLRILPTYLAGSPLSGAHWRRQSHDLNTHNADSYQGLNKVGAFGAAAQQAQEPKKPLGGVDVVPLLCVNTWEHVWLQDYGVRGKRQFLDAWWDRINWDMAAAESPEAAKELVDVANKINGFAGILKQTGTIIKEDDRLPSPEAFDVLDNVIEQSQNVLSCFELATSSDDNRHHDRRDSLRSTGSSRLRLDSSAKAKLQYPMAHLESLSMTLSALLQTLYTAQSIMWSKLRPTVSPQQAAKAVDNEKVQLETLIIQQQLSILFASSIYEQSSQSDARFLMEEDSSKSLIRTEQEETPKPSNLYRYRNRELFNLDISVYTEAHGLPSVCSISSSHADDLLERWTSLPRFERDLRDEELELRKQRQQTQQATVESDSEEEQSQTSKASSDGARRSHRSGSVQPLFTEANLPSPEAEKQFKPPAPPTPADTPRTSPTSIPNPANDRNPPASPSTSLESLPVDAAAAVEAKEEDDEVDLEIPWKLCTRKYYWRFIDAKQVRSNTDQAPSLAFSERNSRTEVMASWVCKEAIREARLPFTQVQKERRDSRRTRFETCFCIERPLQFDQVKRLVERTVEMYRKTAPPTPPVQPKVRTCSFTRQPPNVQQGSLIDRDRTPLPRNTHPPFDRTNSSTNFVPPPPPVGPPPLDRSLSMPGPGLIPPPQTNMNARPANLQIPIPGQQYGQQQPSRPLSPRLPQYQQANGYPSQAVNAGIPQYYPPPPPQHNAPLPYPNTPAPFAPPPQLQPPNPNFNPNYNNHPVQASPLRQSYMNNNPPGYPQPPSKSSRRYDDDFTTSESEMERPRRKREREKSKSRYTDKYGDKYGDRDRERERDVGKYGEKDKYGKRSHTGRKAAAGALLGVGGLTALLDGLSGL
ncbi:fe superoxide dismutase [Stemphylium lycopersici]|uniref:Fe superoxide dismutase n=1 Tax=Stemphylium lycopersici TaxID=183478 RepID=A0A364NFI3_STELY|nr:fe superoxide dismutase [Stemphylium lycopersici]